MHIFILIYIIIILYACVFLFLWSPCNVSLPGINSVFLIINREDSDTLLGIYDSILTESKIIYF